jgi:hypothetical protein
MSLVIRHPEDADAAARGDDARALIPRGAVLAGEIITPSATMNPLRRLDVYNGGYLSRLIEVLESDFGAVRHALGERWFEVASRYVYAHPSDHPNLNRFGRHLPAFLAEQDLEHRAFLVDLARLEWAVTKSFDAPEFEPLDVATLQSLSQEDWARVVFEPNPSLRLEHFDHPVHPYLQAFLDEESPEIPEPAENWIAIYRVDDRVWRLRLSPPAAAILGALIDGQPFAAALEAGGEDAAQHVGHWFQEWSADGLFTTAQIENA